MSRHPTHSCIFSYQNLVEIHYYPQEVKNTAHHLEIKLFQLLMYSMEKILCELILIDQVNYVHYQPFQ